MKAVTKFDKDAILDLVKLNGPTISSTMSRSYKYNKSRLDYEQLRMNTFYNNYSYAIPTQPAITELANYIQNNQVVELNSGLGLWSYLLQQQGVNAIPYNNTFIQN